VDDRDAIAGVREFFDSIGTRSSGANAAAEA
jgi:hypothetical protein